MGFCVHDHEPGCILLSSVSVNMHTGTGVEGAM